MAFSFRKFINKYYDVLFFAGLFAASIVLSFLRIRNYDTAFTFDQAREVLEIRRMVITKTPLLIGPATDIIGLYYGPFWAYFNAIPFILFGGDPLGLVKFQIFTLHIISLIIFFVLRKKDKILAFFSASLFLFSPTAAFSVKFSWNANSAYYFAALFPLFIFFRSKTASFFEGLLCGVILQVEAAIGILFFPISLYRHINRHKKDRYLVSLIIGFFLTLIPQIIFDFRHGFLMTKSLFGEFSGGTDWLGERLSLAGMILNRFTLFRSIFQDSSFLPLLVVVLSIILALIIGKRSSQNQNFLKTNLYLILSFLVFFIIFPFNIRVWYLYGLVPFAIYAFASSLTIISGRKWTKFLSIATVAFAIALSVSSKISYLKTEKGHSNDLANLNNMLIVVDKIYTNAGGRAFKVYTYTPQILDYRYQYLFWWYGTRKYGYQPSDMAYFPGVPEYIKNNSLYWTKKKESDDEITFLIIEQDTVTTDGEENWRNSFPKASEKISLPWNTTIERIDSKLLN